MTSPLARRERHKLCDLALTVGAEAPTLCGDWTVKDLVAHLLVRENRPLAAAGIVVPPLSGLTERSMERMAREDFGVLVEKLRDPGLTMYRIPPAEVAFNTLEYFVHHSDTGAEATLASGDEPVTVSGPPGEVVLFLFGRNQVRDLDIEGPPELVAKVRSADFGF